MLYVFIHQVIHMCIPCLPYVCVFTGQQQCHLVKMIPLLALILRMVIRYRLANVHIIDFFVLVCVQIPGVLIFQFIAPLCFTNAQLFMSKLAAACNIDPEKTSGSSESQPGCVEVAFHKVIHVVHTHTHTHTPMQETWILLH